MKRSKSAAVSHIITTITMGKVTTIVEDPATSGILCVSASLTTLSVPWIVLRVRLGTAGLLTGIECSRVRDSSWMYLTSFVTTRIGVVLAAVQGNYPIVL